MAPSHISWHQARRTESAAYPFFPPQSSSSSSSFTSSGYVTSTSPSNLLQQLRALLWVYPDLARELLPFPFCAGRIPGSPGLLSVQKWAQSQKNQANTRQKAPPWCRTKSVTISVGGMNALPTHWWNWRQIPWPLIFQQPMPEEACFGTQVKCWTWGKRNISLFVSSFEWILFINDRLKLRKEHYGGSIKKSRMVLQ